MSETFDSLKNKLEMYEKQNVGHLMFQIETLCSDLNKHQQKLIQLQEEITKLKMNNTYEVCQMHMKNYNSLVKSSNEEYDELQNNYDQLTVKINELLSDQLNNTNDELLKKCKEQIDDNKNVIYELKSSMMLKDMKIIELDTNWVVTMEYTK